MQGLPVEGALVHGRVTDTLRRPAAGAHLSAQRCLLLSSLTPPNSLPEPRIVTVRTPRGLAFSTAFRLLALLALLCAASTCAWPDRKVDEDASPEAEPSVKERACFEAQKHIEEPLMKQSLWNVWSSTEFWLLTYAASVSMTSINFFIATAYPQMLSVVPSESHAESLNREFSRLLPLGGILFAPLIGTVIDKVGEPLGYLILQCAYAAFTLLLVAFFAIGTGTTGDALARAGFVCFAFCRPLLYTLNPMICGRLFGQEVFGRVFGLMNTIAGFCNLMVQPLAALAHQHGFQGINVGVTSVRCRTGVASLGIFDDQVRSSQLTGRGRVSDAMYQVRFRELPTRKAREMKLKENEHLTVIDCDRVSMPVLYKDSERLVLADAEYNEVGVTSQQLGDAFHLLESGDTVSVLYNEGELVKVVVPTKVADEVRLAYRTGRTQRREELARRQRERGAEG
eukprot:g4545.t1